MAHSLDENKIYIMDGAMGTMLGDYLLPGRPPELLNIDNPEVVATVHRKYVKAGADIIQTNTFGGNRFKLEQHGLADKLVDINVSAVKLAKDVCPGGIVWASVGPTGKLLEPYGELSFQDCYYVFLDQITNLIDAGVDGINIETMGDVHEAKAAVLAAKDGGSSLISVNMTYQENGKTLMGSTPQAVAAIFEAMGVDMIGMNCSLGPEQMLNILDELSDSTYLPIVAQPNAGMPVTTDNKTVFPLSPDKMGEFAHAFISKGVFVLGGCCGTNPSHIEVLKEKTNNLSPVLKKPGKSGTVLSSGREAILVDEDEQIIISDVLSIDSNSYSEGCSNIENIINDMAKSGIHILLLSIEGNLMESKSALINDLINNIQIAHSFSLGLVYAKGIEKYIPCIRGKPWIYVNDIIDLREAVKLSHKYGAGIIVATVKNNNAAYDGEHAFSMAEEINSIASSSKVLAENIAVDIKIKTMDPEGLTDLEIVKAESLILDEIGIGSVSLS